MHNQDKLTVAVVEDDALSQEMICGMLGQLGYPSMPFASAAALAVARRSQVFHALVLDLAMPDVDGFELIYQLAEQRPVEPVVICSGLSNDIKQAARLVCESLDISVLGVLAKPFSGDELAFCLAPHTRAVIARMG